MSEPEQDPRTFQMDEKAAQYLLVLLKDSAHCDHGCPRCVAEPMVVPGLEGFVCIRHRLEDFLAGDEDASVKATMPDGIRALLQREDLSDNAWLAYKDDVIAYLRAHVR